LAQVLIRVASFLANNKVPKVPKMATLVPSILEMPSLHRLTYSLQT